MLFTCSRVEIRLQSQTGRDSKTQINQSTIEHVSRHGMQKRPAVEML